MAYPLFLTVQRVPSPEDIPDLRRRLEIAFPHSENRIYLDELCRSPLPPVTARRFGALSLLPPLLSAAGVDSTALILRRDGHGRPYCETADGTRPFCGLLGAPSSLDFNLSHSDSHVAAALMVGDGRVGVDIEEPIPPPRALPLLRRFCTEGELAVLEDASDDEAIAASFFTSTWVLREALSKQEGGGMPLRFDTARIPADVWSWIGHLPHTDTAIALCAPKQNAPHAPRLTADSIPISVQS